MLKKCLYWTPLGLSRGLHLQKALVKLMLSSNLHVTLRLTVFEIFTVKWQKSVSEMPKMVNPKPFLNPHLETLKISPPKGEKTFPGRSCTVMQTFMLTGRIVAEIPVTTQIETELQQMIYPTKTHTSVCRIIKCGLTRQDGKRPNGLTLSVGHFPLDIPTLDIFLPDNSPAR